MTARFVRHLAATLLLSSGIFACSVTTDKAATPTNAASPTSPTKTATPKSKPKKQAKTSALSALAKSTPPEGAKSEGTKTRPTAGGSTIPIVDVEVYLVVIDFDGDGTDDSIHWAHTDDGVTYFWWEGPVTCEDGLSDGTGGFLMDIQPDGSGSYMFALATCPEENTFGCELDTDGNETTCGACAWNQEAIACVATE